MDILGSSRGGVLRRALRRRDSNRKGTSLLDIVNCESNHCVSRDKV